MLGSHMRFGETWGPFPGPCTRVSSLPTLPEYWVTGHFKGENQIG